MKHKQRLLYSSFKLGLQSFHCILAWEWLQRVMSCVVTAHTLIPALRRQGRQISASEASLVQPSLPRLHSETLSPNNNKVQRKEVRLSGGVLSSMPDTRDLIPSNRYTHTAGHLWSNSQWHPPIQLNTQDSIPSDTCTPSQDVRDSIPTDTHTNTPSFCILNTWNNTNHDSRENVAAYICYFFSIFLGALSPRTMPPNLWGEIIPTLDLSSKHTIVSAQREQDIHRHPRSPIWPPTPSREELEDTLLCQHVQWEKGREASGHQARERQTAETEWLQETATAAKTPACHVGKP